MSGIIFIALCFLDGEQRGPERRGRAELGAGQRPGLRSARCRLRPGLGGFGPQLCPPVEVPIALPGHLAGVTKPTTSRSTSQTCPRLSKSGQPAPGPPRPPHHLPPCLAGPSGWLPPPPQVGLPASRVAAPNRLSTHGLSGLAALSPPP